MEITLELIKELTKLVTEYKLDVIKLGELEIRKASHLPKEETSPFTPNKSAVPAINYWQLSPEEIEAAQPRKRTVE